jgi:hypothetical protein
VSPAASCHDARLAEHRHGGEVEVVERLAGRQVRLDEMAFHTPATTFGELELGQHGEEARRGPTFLVGTLGELWPQPRHGGQPQRVQQQGQLGGIDLDLAHACHSCSRQARRRR